jgi:hypothetical protein
MGRVGCVTLPMPVPSPDKSGGSTNLVTDKYLIYFLLCNVDMYFVQCSAVVHFLLPK